MRRTTLSYNLRPEDRVTHSKWVRVIAAFYGCAALLLLLVAIALPGPSPVQPRGSAAVADPPDGYRPLDAAARRAAQHRARRNGPTDSSGEARVGLDAQNR